MMKIEFKRLPKIDKSEIIELMNHQLVRKQMPLLKDDFNYSCCDKFIADKELLWHEYGYGPWAFVVNDRFAGWGGLQPENGQADLAMVLHPRYWGIGRVLFNKIINKAFREMGLGSVTILLPPSRTRIKGLLRMGFKEEGEQEVGRIRFIRYRLSSVHSSSIEDGNKV